MVDLGHLDCLLALDDGVIEQLLVFLGSADANRPADPRAKVYDDAATAPFLAKDVDKFYKPEIYAAALEAMENADADALEEYIRSHEMPVGKVMNCIRLALSGAASGLGISDILHFIGHEEGLRRLRFLRERLG